MPAVQAKQTLLSADISHWLRDVITPKAQIIDRDPVAMGEAVKAICHQGWMALKRPLAYGGPEMSEIEFRVVQREVARSSGAFAFLTTQHQSAVAMIGSSENQALKEEYLPQMANGGKLVGIGFSQLRRAGLPIMRAERVSGGYRLEGHVPWITGWSFYPEFLVGAALPDGSSVFGILPLMSGPHVQISPPMELAAMGTAMTVTADVSNFFVPDARIVFTKPPGWIQHSDEINIALQVHFALGCARAGIDIVEREAKRKGLDFLTETAQTLLVEWESCRAASETASSLSGQESREDRLQVRAWVIELAVRCAHAAVTASSGAANSVNHPAQRVYREALVFSVSAQTAPIMEATLRRISRRSGV